MTARRAGWTAALVVALLAPLALRLLTAERQGLWQELVTLSGLLATSLLVCTVVLPSRLRSITRSFGIEAVMLNHRVLGLATAGAVLLHVAAVLINDPRSAALLVPFLSQREPAQTVVAAPLLVPLMTPPYRALAGMVATVAMVLLAVVAARRCGRYEVWRSWHLVLALAALAGTAAHVLLIGHLVPTAQLIGWLAGDPLGWMLLSSAMWDPLDALFLAALAAVVLGVGAHRWLRWMLVDTGYCVTRVSTLSPTVSTIRLSPVDRWLRFQPGQFAWLRLTRHPFGEDHPLSVSSAAQDSHSVELMIRHRGDWTERLRALRPGDRVWLDGPHGGFTPDEGAGRLVLIAGGVGIAPMMSILRTAHRSGRHSPRRRRPVTLMLTDEPGQVLFRLELRRLARDLDLTVHDHVAVADVPELLADPERLDYLICGPPAMVRDAVSTLTSSGVPRAQVVTEQF